MTNATPPPPLHFTGRSDLESSLAAWERESRSPWPALWAAAMVRVEAMRGALEDTV